MLTRMWSFTWDTNVEQKQLPKKDRLIAFLNMEAAEAVFQLEEGAKKKKKHYQGYLVLIGKRSSKMDVLRRFQQSFKNVAGLTLKPVHSKVALAAYVTKEEGRIDGPFYVGRHEFYDSEMANIQLSDWQKKVYEGLTAPEAAKLRGRNIISIHDSAGKSGKSTFVKWLRVGQKKLVARKLPVSSVQQLNAAIASITRHQDVDLFMIDITRSLGKEQDFKDLFASLEDSINGYVVDTMYGKYNEAIFKPPMVIIFTNFRFSEIRNLVSQDRWISFALEPYTKELVHIVPEDNGDHWYTDYTSFQAYRKED